MSNRTLALAALVAVVAIIAAAAAYGMTRNDDGGESPSVVLDESSVSLAAGDSRTLTATVAPSSWSGSVAWSTSDQSVATVDSSGKVTAVSAGTATITAKAGSSRATCIVTVASSETRTTSVSLSDPSLSMVAGDTAILTAAVLPSDSTQSVTWRSSDASVATVSGSGKVTAVSVGTTTITATSGSCSATCTVTVSVGSSDVASIDGLTITCDSGTSGIVTYSRDSATGEYTVTFGTITEDSEYTVSGELDGNIVIDVDETETYDFTLNLSDATISSAYESPIVILSGGDVDISAAKGTSNTVEDARSAVDSDEEGVYSGAIHSKVDLKLKGKGALTVTSENNNGVHSKNDLDVKNLVLTVSCVDNALKGDDSVTISSGTVTLYARQGDGIKTVDSDTKTSSSAVTQRGVVTINSDDGDSKVTIYAACDGIDASYDVVIEETEGNSVDLEIYTDAYYSGAETVYGSSGDTLYLKVPSTLYSSKYSYYALFTCGSSTEWVAAEYLKAATGGPGFMGRSTGYYYYTLEKPSDATKVKLYIYSGTPSSAEDSGYAYASSQYTLSSEKDMLVLSSSGSSAIYVSLGSYSTSGSSWSGPGMGGMQEGNSDKTSYSAKGMKAANAITIVSGTISVSAGDDAIHANHDEAIDADTKDSYGFGKGDVTISGGDLTLTSNDDGVHADGTLTVSGGTLTVKKSYEGLEGGTVAISGGTITITSSDDGINGTATTNEDRGTVTQVYGRVTISGGYVYMIAGGDGLDSNCTSAGGLTISGGKIVVVSTSSGNSAIDTDAKYQYSGGYVFAVCPQGMVQEMMNVSGGSYAYRTGILSSSSYVVVNYGSETLAMKMPVSISNAFLFALYSSQPAISGSGSVSYALDSNGVYWSSRSA